MLKVAAVLSLTSPLHIASPEAARVDGATGKMFAGTTGSPCTRTQTHEIFYRPEEGEERVGRKVPVIPANSIRGRFRRQAAEVIKSHLLTRNEKLSLDSYHTLMAGSPNGYPDSAPLDVSEYKKAAAHPFFGVFGGGPRMLPSRVKVDTGYPINEVTLRSMIVPSALDFYAAGVWNTQAVMFRRVDDALTLSDPQIFDVVDNVVESIEDWRELTSSPDGSEDDGEGKVKFQGVRSWTGHEIVKPGTTFYINFTLNSYDEAQRGLFLRAVAGFFNLQNIGGWSRNGYGRYMIEDAKMVSVVDGNETITPFIKTTTSGYELDRDIDDVDSYLLALEESLETVTAAEIEEYATFKKSDVIESKKKKALKNSKKK